MANEEDEVVLYGKFDGDFEVGSDGVWSWKCAGGVEKGNSFAFFVPKTVSFVEFYRELYKILVEDFRIDSCLHELVLRCPLTQRPIPLGPVVISDDRSVGWFISNSDKTCLCITLKAKDINGQSGLVGNDSALSVHMKEINDKLVRFEELALQVERGFHQLQNSLFNDQLTLIMSKSTDSKTQRSRDNDMAIISKSTDSKTQRSRDNDMANR